MNLSQFLLNGKRDQRRQTVNPPNATPSNCTVLPESGTALSGVQTPAGSREWSFNDPGNKTVPGAPILFVPSNSTRFPEFRIAKDPVQVVASKEEILLSDTMLPSPEVKVPLSPFMNQAISWMDAAEAGTEPNDVVGLSDTVILLPSKAVVRVSGSAVNTYVTVVADRMALVLINAAATAVAERKAIDFI